RIRVLTHEWWLGSRIAQYVVLLLCQRTSPFVLSPDHRITRSIGSIRAVLSGSGMTHTPMLGARSWSRSISVRPRTRSVSTCSLFQTSGTEARAGAPDMAR
ncbi:MAG: hypothetical protein RLZZ163_542, partial [Actinomycetota bacterium]